MNFHEVRFPASLSFGSTGGPVRRTEIVTLSNGFEERNTPWLHSRRRYDAGLGLRSLDDVAELIAFFEARQGQVFGFRWKDWSDYKSGLASQAVSFRDQAIGRGDGTTRSFALSKTYRSGAQAYVRPITKAVAGTLVVGVAGVKLAPTAYVVDPATGVVSVTVVPAAGAEVTAGFEFDVPVRFDTDTIQSSFESFEAGQVPSVPVIEVRV